MSNVAVAERPATVTIAPGVTVNSNMTPEERSAVIRTSMGLAPVQRETLPVNGGFHTPATVSRMQQGERELARAPREDGTAPAGIVLADKPAQDALGRWFTGLPTNEQGTVKARYIAASRALQAGGWLEQTATGELIAHEASEPRPGQHAGQIAPTPEELAAANSGDKLAEFDREMREKGAQLPLGEPTDEELGRYDVDGNTGVTVDTWAIENYTRLFRERMADPKISDADKARFREEYREGLKELYAGYTDEDSGESETAQPRDAQGRFAPSQQPPQYTVKQMEEEHAKVADADGWIPLPRVGQWALSGYTLKQFIPNQRLNPAAFGMLANARKAGVSQAQVDAFLENQMRADGWIP